jgi:hypothetical protein
MGRNKLRQLADRLTQRRVEELERAHKDRVREAALTPEGAATVDVESVERDREYRDLRLEVARAENTPKGPLQKPPPPPGVGDRPPARFALTGGAVELISPPENDYVPAPDTRLVANATDSVVGMTEEQKALWNRKRADRPGPEPGSSQEAEALQKIDRKRQEESWRHSRTMEDRRRDQVRFWRKVMRGRGIRL